MRATRPLLLGLAALLALVVAACGGSTEGGSSVGAAVGGAAEIAPAGALAYVALDTEFEGEQWQAAQALFERFPGGQELLDKALADLTSEGLSWEDDLKPALGPEVDLVVLGAEDVVVLTQPADAARLDALLAESEEPAVKAEIDGWTAIAETQAVLDAFTQAQANGTLADDPVFQEATDGLDPDALARFYLNGEGLIEAVAGLQEQAQSSGQLDALGALGGLPAQGEVLEWLSGSVSAEETGVRFQGFGKVEGQAEIEQFSSTLVSQVPAGALVFVTFANLEDSLDQALDQAGEQTPELDQQLGQLELFLGISVRADLLPLFGGEGAIAVYPGTPIPVVSLILTTDDEQAALATVEKLIGAASLFAGQAGGDLPAVTDTDVDGIPAKELNLGQFSLYVAAFDEKLVLTTGRDGITGLRAEGEKLAGDPDFTAARDAAEMPGETIGFAYVNFAKLTDLIDGLAQLSDEPLPPEVEENLRHLGGMLVWASQDGGQFELSGFLGIE